MCPYKSPEAKKKWSKACNFSIGVDLNHQCGNALACQRTLEAAWSEELLAEGWA